MARDISDREVDALANMMGADSRRIDDLVSNVGQVRGDVSHLRGDVGRLVQGVDDLKEAMVGVARHSVLLEAQRREADEMRRIQQLHDERTDQRLSVLEREMPGLIEWRTYTVRAVMAVAGLVGLAVVALVLKATP